MADESAFPERSAGTFPNCGPNLATSVHYTIGAAAMHREMVVEVTNLWHLRVLRSVSVMVENALIQALC